MRTNFWMRRWRKKQINCVSLMSEIMLYNLDKLYGNCSFGERISKRTAMVSAWKTQSISGLVKKRAARILRIFMKKLAWRFVAKSEIILQYRHSKFYTPLMKPSFHLNKRRLDWLYTKFGKAVK